MPRNGVELRWLEVRDPAAQIHLCAVNSDKRAAAVCGFGSPFPFQRVTRGNNNMCATCQLLDKSGDELNFKMPNGATVRVRDRQRPQ